MTIPMSIVFLNFALLWASLSLMCLPADAKIDFMEDASDDEGDHESDYEGDYECRRAGVTPTS